MQLTKSRNYTVYSGTFKQMRTSKARDFQENPGSPLGEELHGKLAKTGSNVVTTGFVLKAAENVKVPGSQSLVNSLFWFPVL